MVSYREAILINPRAYDYAIQFYNAISLKTSAPHNLKYGIAIFQDMSDLYISKYLSLDLL